MSTPDNDDLGNNLVEWDNSKLSKTAPGTTTPDDTSDITEFYRKENRRLRKRLEESESKNRHPGALRTARVAEPEAWYQEQYKRAQIWDNQRDDDEEGVKWFIHVIYTIVLCFGIAMSIIEESKYTWFLIVPATQALYKATGLKKWWDSFKL